MPTTTLNPVYNSGDSNDGSRAVDNALYAGNSDVTTKQFGAKGELVMKLKVGLGLSWLLTVVFFIMLLVKQCEDCHVKQAYWGMADRRMRWCSKCAKASPGHPGSIDLINKKCEDCKTKSQVWGLLSEGRKRWCASCGKTHKGAGAVSQTKCRGCQGPRPTYAMAIGQRAIWCARCGKANNGVACPRVKRDRQLPPVPAPPSPGATVGMASLSAVASAAVARTVATAVVVLQPEAARASTAAERARCIACAHGGCSVHLAPEEAALSEA